MVQMEFGCSWCIAQVLHTWKQQAEKKDTYITENRIFCFLSLQKQKVHIYDPCQRKIQIFKIKRPWIQEKLFWNVVNSNSQISCSSKIDDLERTRTCSSFSGHKTCVLIFSLGSLLEKVQELRWFTFWENNVLRLNIPMDNPGWVKTIQCKQELPHDSLNNFVFSFQPFRQVLDFPKDDSFYLYHCLRMWQHIGDDSKRINKQEKLHTL